MAGAAQQAILLNCVGNLEYYDPNVHKFDMWLGQFSEFCILNNFAVEPTNAQGQVLPAHNRRRALFLTHIGSRAFEVVSAACAPRFPREFPIGHLASLIKEKFENPGHAESNRVLFHSRIQTQGESVFDYISAIQILAQVCDFGNAYNMIMKTRLISGIRHEDTKVKLLEPALTFDQAKQIAINDDRIRIHMKTLATQVNSVSVRGGHQPSYRSNNNGRGRGRGGRGGSNENRGRGRGSVSNRGGHTRGNANPNHRGNANANGRGNANPNNRGNANSRGYSNRGNYQQGNYQQSNGKNFRPCRRCGREHDEKTCPAVSWQCYKCLKYGHIAPLCKPDQVNNVENNNNQEQVEVNDVVDRLMSHSQPFSVFDVGM